MQDVTQDVSPQLTQHSQQIGALYTVCSANCPSISLPSQRVISSTTQHSGETETETEYHEYLDYPGNNPSSQSLGVAPACQYPLLIILLIILLIKAFLFAPIFAIIIRRWTLMPQKSPFWDCPHTRYQLMWYIYRLESLSRFA